MSISTLRAIPTPPPPDTRARRIARLQAEARTLAREHITLLVANLRETGALAAAVAEGGDAYPVGARELCRRLAEEARKHADTLTAIQGR